MREPRAFCQALMHEYERQWAAGGGHAIRHPLRLKMERLKGWCDESCSAEDFADRLRQAETSDDPGESLLAAELLSLWREVAARGRLPFQ
jgi:hypothetical protein